jgi:hypothetical protein
MYVLPCFPPILQVHTKQKQTVYYAGISMGYLYLMMGVIISSAVIPATLTIMWAGHNKWAAMLTPPFGLICALIAWLVTAKKECGSLNVDCTGSNNPMLAGNVTALLSPLIFIPIFTLIFGWDKYDWVSMAAIRRGDDHDLAAEADVDLELVPGASRGSEAEEVIEQRKLLRASTIAKTMTVILTLALLVLWPMPMYGSGYVFSEKFFTGWVVVGIIVCIFPNPYPTHFIKTPKKLTITNSGSSAPPSASASTPSSKAASRSRGHSNQSTWISPANSIHPDIIDQRLRTWKARKWGLRRRRLWGRRKKRRLRRRRGRFDDLDASTKEGGGNDTMYLFLFFWKVRFWG